MLFDLDTFAGNRFFIGNNGTSFSQYTTLDVTLDNFYFAVEAVPEPATYALAAAGLLAIGILRRRK